MLYQVFYILSKEKKQQDFITLRKLKNSSPQSGINTILNENVRDQV